MREGLKTQGRAIYGISVLPAVGICSLRKRFKLRNCCDQDTSRKETAVRFAAVQQLI